MQWRWVGGSVDGVSVVNIGDEVGTVSVTAKEVHCVVGVVNVVGVVYVVSAVSVINVLCSRSSQCRQ